jgi:type III restriction enzyme
MEFKFDGKQEFQTNAVESIARMFDGQARIESTIRYEARAGFLGSPNHLDLTEDDILRNLQIVQQSNSLQSSPALELIEREVEAVDGKKKSSFANFSVEMETGTGKTYVYIRTALELNKRFGFRRFIIVVPSIAVKEGVLKTFEVTEKHFRELYGNVPYKFYPYDSSNLTQVRQFASSSNIEFMVMTLDSFNKALTENGKGNVIRRPTDRLQGATPIHLVQASRPILILDEPQNMESENSIAALADLDPLLALRYSATHRKPYNLVYRLTPTEAYRQGLVKKIEVASVTKEDDVNQVFIQLEGIESKKNKVTASVLVNKLMKPGTVKSKSVTVRISDNLQDKTNLPEYVSFLVEEINPGSGTITFGNGIQMQIGEARGADKEAVFEAQIRYTIEEHFRKQKRLKQFGLKVLSLFFIDKVDNYVDDGLIHRLFVKAFNELKQKYPEWNSIDSEEVQASYFAFTKKKGGERIYEDSNSGKESEKDKEAYDLIMRDKERLLSFDSGVSFSFHTRRSEKDGIIRTSFRSVP